MFSGHPAWWSAKRVYLVKSDEIVDALQPYIPLIPELHIPMSISLDIQGCQNESAKDS